MREEREREPVLVAAVVGSKSRGVVVDSSRAEWVAGGEELKEWVVEEREVGRLTKKWEEEER